MANVQVEDGALAIADKLVVAMLREDFTAVQFRVIFAIMNMTFRVGKTKAIITNDDLRYATNSKAYKVQAAVGDLLDRKILFAQHLTNGQRLLGIQKDYDQWLPKMGTTINSYLEVNNNNLARSAVPKMGNKGQRGNSLTPPGRILTWVLKELNIELKLGAWRKEYSKMVELYVTALDLAHEPYEAYRAIKDYFDFLDDPSFRSKVTRPASFMLTGFKNWYRQLPKKTKDIREQEEVTGYRFRYNIRYSRWEMSNEKLKPNP